MAWPLLGSSVRRTWRSTVTAVLGWILFGLVVGIVAKLLTPGRDPGGFILTILLGIAGALLGGFIGRWLGFYGQNRGAGFIVSVIGAIVLLLIYRAVSRPRMRQL
jgi:uncharacterized membrane protein YeaQ/YmgE (transglycosylase-associated protein family)